MIRSSQSAVRAAFLLAILTLGTGRTLAQTQTGDIFVRVRDAQGKALPGATVTVSSSILIKETSTQTGADGACRVPSLPPGEYQVEVGLDGFQTQRFEHIRVSAAATATLTSDLDLSELRETITISGRAPTVDTGSSSVSSLLNEAILQETPGAHDVWSLLEYKVPSLVSSRPDVGGQESGLQAGFVAKGTPHGQNTQALNGVNVSDPEAIGFADFYYDYDSFEEVQVSTASHSIEVGTPGVYVNMVTKRGSDEYHGALAAYYQDDGTQSNNVDSELRAQGIQQAGFDFLSDVGAQLGGPIAGERLRFFASVRDWRVHRFVNGFVDESGNPEVESTDLFSWLANVTWQASDSHELGFFATTQTYDKPQRGASGLNSPLSAWKEDDEFDIYQLSWNGLFSSNLYGDAKISFVDIFFPLFIKEEARARGLQSSTEATTGFVSHANANEFIFLRERLQAKGALSYADDDLGGARHEFRFGFDLSHSPNQFSTNAIDELNLTTVGGEAGFVTLFNTPVDVRRGVDTVALFASDSVRLDRWTITAGLRLEHTEGFLPKQQSTPSRWFPDALRQFDRVDDIVKWDNVAPRLSAVWDIDGEGQAVLKLSVGRYYYQISTGIPDAVNRNGLSGETFVWNDLDGDLQFQQGEAGNSLGAFGGLVTSIDPGLDQPFSDELVASFDYALASNFRIGANVTYRRDQELIGQRNTTAIWLPTEVTDPDTGTGITVFAQDPATLADNRFRIVNADSLDIEYLGLELIADKRYSDKWQLLGSYTLSRAEQDQIADLFGTGTPAVDPNNQVNASGPTFWDRTHIVKASAIYHAPWGIDLAANLRIQTGQPFSRQILVTGLPQGTFTVNAEPRGERRYPTISTLDLRVARAFRFRGLNIQAAIDAFNVTNENSATSLIELSGPRFRFPLTILGPRIIRFGARLTF